MHARTHSMREIVLTKGKVAVVANRDFPFLNQWRWHAVQCRGLWYAARWQMRGVRQYMHRLIVGAKSGEEVDHRDGDGLHNTKRNLRKCSHSNNLVARLNTRPNKSSRYRGVTWDKWASAWSAKTTYLGRFADEISAARAFDTHARKHYGTFGRLNFP